MNVKSILSAIALALALPAQLRADGIIKGPYLQNPTTKEISVCWVSDAVEAGTVTYARTLPGGKTSNTHVARESKPVQFHKVRLKDLQPYSVYEYEVECAGKKSGLSTFLTAAPVEQPFKFIAYGDTRTQPDKHAAVIARMRKFHPDFVTQSGDLVANGESEPLWDEFWRVVAPLVRETPYYPSLGNHEVNGAPYFRYFDVKREYSFDYGNAHFVSIDTNRPPSEHKAQEKWLRKDLESHQNATWRIVFFHHTPYTCSVTESRRVDSVSLRARLEPIFMKEKVQLVITGHDHNYQHHFANGIHYIVSGGGGAPLYDFRLDTPFTKKARKAYHDCEITVNGDKMGIRVVEPNGSVIEEFYLRAAP
jgi:Icc-related predicted phosphoesterase